MVLFFFVVFFLAGKFLKTRRVVRDFYTSIGNLRKKLHGANYLLRVPFPQTGKLLLKGYARCRRKMRITCGE
jgi:hypothetical protein